MFHYPKIETLYSRDGSTFKVRRGTIRCPEFALINKWLFHEKIDGMNIRIEFDYKQYWADNLTGVSVAGRTARADLPKDLHTFLVSHFTPALFNATFPDNENAGYPITLFGEGYGAGIQKGGAYRTDKGFMLFDVRVGDWWLEWHNVLDVAEKMCLPVVPRLLFPTLEEAVEAVAEGFSSLAAHEPRPAEGIVARTSPLLLTRNDRRVMWKLKTTDF